MQLGTIEKVVVHKSDRCIRCVSLLPCDGDIARRHFAIIVGLAEFKASESCRSCLVTQARKEMDFKDAARFYSSFDLSASEQNFKLQAKIPGPKFWRAYTVSRDCFCPINVLYRLSYSAINLPPRGRRYR